MDPKPQVGEEREDLSKVSNEQLVDRFNQAAQALVWSSHERGGRGAAPSWIEAHSALKPELLRRLKEARPATAESNGITIQIRPRRFTTDPPIWIYEVELLSKEGVWRETYGSREVLLAFLRGLEAAAAMLGHQAIQIPSIPPESQLELDVELERAERES